MTSSRQQNRLGEHSRLGQIGRHFLLGVSFLFLFLLLNRPEIIALSQLGATAWYPGTGFAVAFMLSVSPWYGFLAAFCDTLSGILLYHQPVLSFSGTIGAVAFGGFYAGAAYVLRGPWKIDPELRQRQDVVRYLLITSAAAGGSTLVGVACLAAEHSVAWSQYWHASLSWFFGDETGILGVAPFLLVHVSPWVRRKLSPICADSGAVRRKKIGFGALAEAIGQSISIIVTLWLIFGRSFGFLVLYFLSFVPIIWIAMRQGIRRVVTGLLILNFSIAVALQHRAAALYQLDKAGLLMFVVSAVGLAVGAAVSERHRIAVELTERTNELRAVNKQLLTSKVAADAASLAKSEFLANMSHEIRTPINGIMGMAELALETPLTPDQQDYLVTLKASADSLLEIVNDILDFSKIESGKLELDISEFDLHEMIGSTLRTVALRAHEKGLELCLRIGQTVPECVVGDAGRLRQILLNLVGNAIKFTSDGEILVEIQEVARHQDAVELHFSVADSGIGIPIEKQALIFERFAQADGSTTRNYGGTGLGLAICARLLDLMGGRIWVDSFPGKGSTFHFSVGVRETMASGCDARDRKDDLSGLRVLVVDDSTTVRCCLTDICSQLGMEVSTASSGSLALSLFGEPQNSGNAFDLVIVDRHMLRSESGIKLAERLRGDGAPGVIVTVTTSDHHADQVRYDQGSMFTHVLKPVQKSELVSAMRIVLDFDLPGKFPESTLEHCSGEPRALRVLVAEDNLINQKAVLAMLRKMGHSAEVTSNGQDALQVLESERFDLIVMDVQMPLMDGLTTTRRIRENERRTGKHIPILALTAHATEDYKAQCLKAGMDAYVAKPVNEAGLADAILSLFQRKNEGDSALHTELRPKVWHRLDAIKQVGGDESLLDELVGIFLEEYPKRLAGLYQATRNADAVLVEQISHSLKSELGYLGMTDAGILARDLEMLGRSRKLEGAADLLGKLDACVSAAMLEMESARGTKP